MNLTPRHGKRSAPLANTPDKVLRTDRGASASFIDIKASHSPRVVNIMSWDDSDATPKPEECILRDFDLNLKFGPCCEISRSARWERAKRLGLCPPEEIVSLIETTKHDVCVLDVHMHQVCC